jgi:uncharacterized protein YciI
MEHRRYVIFLDQIKGVKTTETHIRDHVQFLKKLDESGQLELCDPFIDHQGGMVIIKATSLEEAKEIALSDPFVKSGVRNCEIRSWQLSCEENNHLGMG